MEKDYSDFTTDDFIADEFFQQWVKFPDKETNEFWNKWLAAHPEKRDEVTRAGEFINHLSFSSDPPTHYDVEASLARSLERIKNLESDETSKRAKRTSNKYWLGTAVVIIAIVFTAKFYADYAPATIEISTTAKEIKSVILPDSSVITLNSGSSIKYPADFDIINTREVWLTGEAFFKVKHIEKSEKSRRFIVHSADLNVEVLGTSFNVKKRKDVSNVSLNEGNIKVRINDDEGSTIFLKPGEFFQYSASNKNILKKKVKPELYSDWKEKKMVLDNTPLSEVAELIHDSYGYNTIVQGQGLAAQKVSGTLVLNNEAVFLEALSFALNINIIKKGTDLIFENKTKNK